VLAKYVARLIEARSAASPVDMDLLRRAGRFNEAATTYEQALKLTTNAVERGYLEWRLREVRNDIG